jgi:uncharacterized protein YndB with AHSA1/START domain
MTLDFTIDVRAPVNSVFCWMTRRDKIEQWLPLIGNRITHDTVGRVGTTLRQEYESRGRRMSLDVEVLRFETNRCLAIRIRTKKQSTVYDYRMGEHNGGTRLMAAIDIRLLGLMKLVGFLVGDSLRDRVSRDCREDFHRLKRLCEQECAR